MTASWNKHNRLDPRFRLDHVFTCEIDPETGKEKRGFETVEDSIEEDHERARCSELGQPKRLNWTNDPIRRFNFQQPQHLPHLTTPEIPVAQVNALMRRLAAGAHSGEHCGSMASSLAMRELRLPWIGAVTAFRVEDVRAPSADAEGRGASMETGRLCPSGSTNEGQAPSGRATELMLAQAPNDTS